MADRRAYREEPFVAARARRRGFLNARGRRRDDGEILGDSRRFVACRLYRVLAADLALRVDDSAPHLAFLDGAALEMTPRGRFGRNQSDRL